MELLLRDKDAVVYGAGGKWAALSPARALGASSPAARERLDITPGPATKRFRHSPEGTSA